MALVASVASFSIPSLLGRPIVPQLMRQDAPQLPAQGLIPADIRAQADDGTFDLRVSGNVYFDKLPVQGAVVTVYLNGRQVGRTTAGDIYMFEVPGVRMGDTIRVDAAYEGFTGTSSEVVQFKSMSLNVNIRSGRSFIRNALEMLPTESDIAKAEQQGKQQQQQPAQQQASQPAGSSTTTSSADAKELTSQIFGDTANQLANIAGRSSNAVTSPATAAGTADAGRGMSLADIQNAIKDGGMSGLTF